MLSNESVPKDRPKRPQAARVVAESSANTRPEVEPPTSSRPVAQGSDAGAVEVAFKIELSKADRELLENMLPAAQEGIARALTPFAQAAMREYVEMFTGRAPIGRASDVKELRLLAMILEDPQHHVPEEDLIGKLFQLTPQESQQLRRRTLTRYQHRLREVSGALLRAAFQQIEAAVVAGQTSYEVVLAALVVEELNAIILRRNPMAPQIRRQPGTGSVYKVDNSAVEALRQELGIQI